MTLPIDLILVRHGESEGNIANAMQRDGDLSAFTEEFRKRHNSDWRLTKQGRRQAVAAGYWLEHNDALVFSRYTVSTYKRAMQTAALLNLPGARWSPNFFLRERDMGVFDAMPDHERQQSYSDYLSDYKRDPFHSCPPGGESIANLCSRLHGDVLDTLHRECSDGKVIIVCHGIVMWGLRILLERITPWDFVPLYASTDPKNMIHNCQILHYTRRDEEGNLHPTAVRVRSVCPWNPELSSNDWREIERKKFSNSELIDLVSPD